MKLLRVDILLALGLSGGLHLLMFAQPPETAGLEAAGEQGTEILSMVAADESIASMVSEWTRPVAATQVAPQLKPVTQPQTRPAQQMVLAQIQMPVTRAMPMAIAPPEPAVPVQVDTRAPSRPKPPVAASKKVNRSSAQKAAGAGGSKRAGTGQRRSQSSKSKAQTQRLQNQWGAAIRARIERKKRYPSAAGGAQGRVTLRISVHPSGKLIGAKVARGSGNRALDNAALRAVQRAGRFPKAPKGIASAISFNLPVSFQR